MGQSVLFHTYYFFRDFGTGMFLEDDIHFCLEAWPGPNQKRARQVLAVEPYLARTSALQVSTWLSSFMSCFSTHLPCVPDLKDPILPLPLCANAGVLQMTTPLRTALDQSEALNTSFTRVCSDRLPQSRGSPHKLLMRAANVITHLTYEETEDREIKRLAQGHTVST